MAFREVSVFEIKEVLRLWLGGEGYRAAQCAAKPLTPTLSPMGRGSNRCRNPKEISLAQTVNGFCFTKAAAWPSTNRFGDWLRGSPARMRA